MCSYLDIDEHISHVWSVFDDYLMYDVDLTWFNYNEWMDGVCNIWLAGTWFEMRLNVQMMEVEVIVWILEIWNMHCELRWACYMYQNDRYICCMCDGKVEWKVMMNN